MKAKSTRPQNPWDDRTVKELIRLYNHKDEFSSKEIAFRLNKKFSTERTTGSVGQQVVKVRRDKPTGMPKLRPINKQHTPGFLSEKAEAFQAKVDTKAEKRKNGKKKNGAAEPAPRRSSLARAGKKGRDPLLDNEVRVLEADLRDKGYVRVEISGAILLNEEIVGSLSAAVSRCLTI